MLIALLKNSIVILSGLSFLCGFFVPGFRSVMVIFFISTETDLTSMPHGFPRWLWHRAAMISQESFLKQKDSS